jgi:hypothetical protein
MDSTTTTSKKTETNIPLFLHILNFIPYLLHPFTYKKTVQHTVWRIRTMKYLPSNNIFGDAAFKQEQVFAFLIA